MSVWEIAIILAVLATMLAIMGVVVFVVIRFASARNGPTHSPHGHPLPGSTCPRCGSTLTADAPQGLCPRCVLQVGIGTQFGAGADSNKRPAPSPEELAAHFPQLEILELIGQGGMGAVYRARQKDLDRLVALKVLPVGAATDPAFAERFTREARALARLNHPNIVAVHDFGQAGGFYYFVMELIDGLNLRQMMRAQKLSPREATTIVPQICEALQFAHDAGIVHRDIKPENILLDKRGRVKIADFGLAKLLGVDVGPGERLTQSQQVMGTPHYMAPEQVERPTEVDHRADIYSLGVVFYEMLTGELPIGRFAPPSRRVTVDVRLDEVVLRALEKEPEQRYQQASQVKTDVETIATTPPSATPGSEEAHAANPGKEPRLVVPETTRHVPASRSLGRRLVISAGVALAMFLVTVVAMSVITFSRPKTYVSAAQVVLLFKGANTSQTVETFRQTQAARLQSEMVLSQVASNLNLGQRWSGKVGEPELDNDHAISLLRERIEVRPVPGTTILSVFCSADSPDEAREIAEQVTDVFCRTGGPAGATILQRANQPQVGSPNIALILVVVVVAAPLLALLSGVVAFAFVTKRSRAAAPAVEPTRPRSSGAVWAVAAVGIVVGMVFLALAAGSVILAIYLPARARERVEVMQRANLTSQAEMMRQHQQAEATAQRDELLRSLNELRRQGLTDMHPKVQELRARLVNMEIVATNLLDGTTDTPPAQSR